MKSVEDIKDYIDELPLFALEWYSKYDIIQLVDELDLPYGDEEINEWLILYLYDKIDAEVYDSNGDWIFTNNEIVNTKNRRFEIEYCYRKVCKILKDDWRIEI